jgi:deoxyguanosine kinase
MPLSGCGARFEWYAIEGLVGAGKTTTAQLAASGLGMPAILEQTEAHPFIAAYYRDPRRFAMETELIFMAIHLHQVKTAAGRFVTDFSPERNIMYGERQLQGADLAALKAVHSHLWRDLPRPVAALFLDVPAKVCLERIRLRGRAFEQGIAVDELESLRESYLANLSTLAVDVTHVKLTGDEPPELVAKRASSWIAEQHP